MENRQHLENYISQRLKELDKEKDMQEVALKGKLSFGINSRLYSHLPNWKNLVEKKKQLVRWVWLNAVFLSFIITAIVSDPFSSLRWASILRWIGVSVAVLLFVVIFFFHALFFQFRRSEREVRRLIYEDMLHQLKKEEKEAA
jgi:undecaprenyl pyrophosphate phosphatase UppP